MTLDTAKATVTLRDLTVKFDIAARKAVPFYPNLCNVVDSDGKDEAYSWLGSMPSMRKWLGDRRFNELRAAKFTIVNEPWEDSVLIDRDDEEDDRLGMYVPLLEQLANRAMKHPDKLVMQLMADGGTTLCWDGQYFYDTDHAWGDSGTQSNALTFDATDHTKVTATEALDAYHLARAKILSYKDDNGEYMNADPIVVEDQDFVLVCGLALETAFKKGLRSTILGNNSNVVIGGPQIVASPYLADTKFTLNYVNAPLKGFIFQQRRPLAKQIKGREDREYKFLKYMVDARYNAGYGVWWTSVQTTFN